MISFPLVGARRRREEAWSVHALVRDDGMTQVEVAERLSRHKTWVCRRLALVEKLTELPPHRLHLIPVSEIAAHPEGEPPGRPGRSGQRSGFPSEPGNLTSL